MSMTYNLRVDWEVIQGLVKATLMDDYRSAEESVRTYKAKDDVDKLDTEDYIYNKELMKALETVIVYYAGEHEFRRFTNEIDREIVDFETPRLDDHNWG